MTTLTVVIPVHDEERWIGSTLQALGTAARGAPALDVDVVVVDDGSTDGTAAVAESTDVGLPLSVLRQENTGRFGARLRGLEVATGELVLFLDSRVTIAPGSLAFVADRLAADPHDAVWNAHVVIDTAGNPYGLFWNALTELAFAAYFDDPRTTHFGPEDFDRFPKGTTCFLAPVTLLRESYGTVSSYYADSRYANDDTPMIRRIASVQPIGISPSFSCLYRPRQALRPFLRHAFHRGIVFLDGHGRRGARLLPAVAAFYPASVALAALTLRRPGAAALAVASVGAAAGLYGAARGRPHREVAALAGLAPVYATAHGLGMWKGLGLALRSRPADSGA